MIALLRMELSKAMKNKWFFIALSVGVAFSLVSAAQYIIPQMTSQFTPSPDKFYNYTAESCFTAWMSLSQGAVPLLFYQIAPLLAVLPYVWSLRSELKDGYIAQVYARTHRECYLIAKYVAVCCSAGVVAVAPQVLNFVLLACFFPAYVPTIDGAMYTTVFWDSIGSWLFYNVPLAYVGWYCVIDFGLCGFWAGFVLALSCLIRNRVVVLVVPYLSLLLVQFVNEKIFLALGGLNGLDVSLFENLRGGAASYLQNGWVILAMCLAFFALAGGLMALCRQRDVL